MNDLCASSSSTCDSQESAKKRPTTGSSSPNFNGAPPLSISPQKLSSPNFRMSKRSDLLAGSFITPAPRTVTACEPSESFDVQPDEAIRTRVGKSQDQR